MPKLLSVSCDNDSFAARPGEIILDAATRGGLDLPHDCRAGHCGACTIEVTEGFTLGGETGEARSVRACQARIFSDLVLKPADGPALCRVDGKVTALSEIADGIMEVTIQPSQQLDWLPGQYCNVRFRGFPARSFSPTACLRSARFDKALRFHIKRVRDGRVTTQIGEKIGLGHAVRIEGPYGHAHHRPGRTNRLVLAASGTGFAPIWAITAAALQESDDRPIVLVCGSREARSFYMMDALMYAARHRNVSIIPTVESLSRKRKFLSSGTPAQNIPALQPDDIVYAAGSPRLVVQISEKAKSAGSVFYADPFESGPKRTIPPVMQLISMASNLGRKAA